MTIEREALKLALEALERSVATCFDQYAHQQVMSQPDHFINKAITAIKEALAQPEQEPVAWQWLDTAHFRKKLPKDAGDGVWNPLYAAPQRTERPVDCERCNRLEEQAYDLVGKLRVANIKLSMQPQRTWVGLTEDELERLIHNFGNDPHTLLDEVDARLRNRNT